MRDSKPFKILCLLNEKGKNTEVAKALSLPAQSASAILCAMKRKNFISQKKKFAPYVLASKGKAAIHSFDIKTNTSGSTTKTSSKQLVLLEPTASKNGKKNKKSGAPKNGKITNGVVKFSKPGSMSTSMFNELVGEHGTAERRAEAIENLFHNWPR